MDGASANVNAKAEDSVESLRQRFVQQFGSSPQIYQAPGRVNLIGEHTDYNDGFVMPAAIGFRTLVAVSSRADQKLVIHSENYSDQVEFDLDRLPAKRANHWSDYAIGVVKMLLESGRKLNGMNFLVEGDVPQGAGLSSSASIEVAVGYALMDLADGRNASSTTDLTQLALLCQRAENEFVGARCGIMDQFVASHGKRGHALMLDCRSLEYSLVPLPQDAVLAICNTMVKHSIAKGEYNQRRSECETGVRILAQRLPNVRSLRDVTLADIESCRDDLPEVVLRRCRHVVTENGRVLQAAAALHRGDLSGFGKLMLASHRSLREDFEVSCPELDLMVELAESLDGVFGARMTGGGFGGCTIALIDAEASHIDAFQQTVGESYERSTGCKPEIYVCSAADGVGRVM
jgi:galactokinase